MACAMHVGLDYNNDAFWIKKSFYKSLINSLQDDEVYLDAGGDGVKMFTFLLLVKSAHLFHDFSNKIKPSHYV